MQRVISKVSNGSNTIDGSNVHIKRLIGNDIIRMDQLSPILLFDEIKNTIPSHYMGGFPLHPHRGFTTITYLIEGSLEHEDSRGNNGILTSGSVQYMVAGRGIVHSEMPINENKLFHCIQIWINLKSKDKMIEPRYQDIQSSTIPKVIEDDYEIKVISGKYRDVEGPLSAVNSNPLILDIILHQPNSKITDITIPSSYNACVYIIQGSGRFGPCEHLKQVYQDQIGIFFNNGGESNCNDILQVINSSDEPLRFLLLAAEPIYNENVAHYGTIVMNTQEEINQSLLDFQLNNF